MEFDGLDYWMAGQRVRARYDKAVELLEADMRIDQAIEILETGEPCGHARSDDTVERSAMHRGRRMKVVAKLRYDRWCED